MSIEKAFAINAPPEDIYAALERDIASAARHQGETFEVLRRARDHSMDLRVTIGGVPCWLTYRLDRRPDHTEVVATLTPFGMKYVFFNIITLGMRKQGFEIALVEGLANLKEEVEGVEEIEEDVAGGEADFPDEGTRLAVPPDE